MNWKMTDPLAGLEYDKTVGARKACPVVFSSRATLSVLVLHFPSAPFAVTPFVITGAVD